MIAWLIVAGLALVLLSVILKHHDDTLGPLDESDRLDKLGKALGWDK